MRSINSKGPIRNPTARASASSSSTAGSARSRSAADAAPEGRTRASDSIDDESRRIGDENAGLFCRCALRVRTRARRRCVARLRYVATTSTSCMREPSGLKKCSPTTRSGCATTSARSATASDDVLVARIASAASALPSAKKTSRFSSKRSGTASIAIDAPQPSMIASVQWIRPRIERSPDRSASRCK